MQNFYYLGEEASVGKALKKKARDSGNKIGLLFLLLVVLQLSVSLLYEIVITVLTAVGHSDAAQILLTSTATQFVVYLISLGLCILIARMFISMRQFNYHEDVDTAPIALALPSEKVSGLDFFSAVFVCLGAAMAGNFITTLIDSILAFLDLPTPEISFGTPTSVAETVLYFISIAILPPFLEEILCRGYIYQLTKGYGAFVSSVIGGVTFMLFHQNFAQFPLAFCFGFAMGYMIYRFKNIWIGIVAHFINNFMASIITLMMEAWGVSENFTTLFSEIYVATAISLGVISLAYLLASGKLKTTPATDRCPGATATILFSPAYIVFAVISIGLAVVALFLL